jgi:radical SAM protein with 4Fe4S-binding SPASM domain
MMMTFEEVKIENIGWTLGNDCPYRCEHCYSTIVRNNGMELTKQNVDRIVEQLSIAGIKTVNLGGNEPIFTNGTNPKNSLLPYIIDSLHENNILVGLTTAGISLITLEKMYISSLLKLNDIDVSFDSPFEIEHNANRGANIYSQALKALDICNKYDIPHTIVTCGMNWNLTEHHISAFIDMAKKYNSFIRVNFLKPTEEHHINMMPTQEQFYQTSIQLLNSCEAIEMGEPLLSAMFNNKKDFYGCPCGSKSFRIHSITPQGEIPISPCVYAHDYKVGSLLSDDLIEILKSEEFRLFRSRNTNPALIKACSNCKYIEICKGGCASRAYLSNKFEKNTVSLNQIDPYCLLNIENKQIDSSHISDIVTENNIQLVHRNYLCTLIVKPKL